MKKTRILSLILASLMTASTLVSCANESTADSGSETQPDVSADKNIESDTEPAEDDGMAALLVDVPKADYGGYDFVMLNLDSSFAYTAMTAEEYTGEGINDAIHTRNIKVADDLNIKISENIVGYETVTSEMNTAIAAGDETYDCFWNESQFLASFALDGKLLNVNEIAAIDLEKPWWNKTALEDVEIGDMLYFLVGDIHLMFKESFWMVGFNKNIIDEHSLDDPYEIVREGKWTLDVMQDYMSTVASDLDGNGVMDGDDRFGVTCYNGCVTALFIGCDEEFVEKDSDGVPHFVTVSDRFYSVQEKIANTVFNTAENYTCLDGVTQNISKYPDGWHGVFKAGHALFYLEPIGSLKKLRDMDSEFGIIPYPKYDEIQKDYVTYIANYAAFCGIPVTAKDVERTGTILENLGAQSYGELRQEYENATLNFKYIRDKESSEMLNLIFSTGRFNLTDQIGVNNLKDALTTTTAKGRTGVASALAKIFDISVKLLDENVEKLLKGPQIG